MLYVTKSKILVFMNSSAKIQLNPGPTFHSKSKRGESLGGSMRLFIGSVEAE